MLSHFCITWPGAWQHCNFTWEAVDCRCQTSPILFSDVTINHKSMIPPSNIPNFPLVDFQKCLQLSRRKRKIWKVIKKLKWKDYPIVVKIFSSLRKLQNIWTHEHGNRNGWPWKTQTQPWKRMSGIWCWCSLASHSFHLRVTFKWITFL